MNASLPEPALQAILEAIDGIMAATAGKTLDDPGGDWLLRHGVQRGIEIISEATRRLPPDMLTTQPHVPWAQIAGIGNVLRHEYHRISDRIVWNVVATHLPALRDAVEMMKAALSDRPPLSDRQV
ncbi:MAG: HepT-like ribonuclease domain-containing protein [Rhodospirillales bacterium]